MTPAIEYTRASTSKQEYSVGDQDKQIRSWAARNNYKIVRSYCDDGLSGHYASKRPGFLQMIEDITSGAVEADALLIWDSYRFARNMVEFLTYKQMIQQHGLSVIAISEPQVQDSDAQLYIDAINGASGELYLRKLSKDSKRGIRARVVDRHEHHGPAPFGYKSAGKELEPDPKQAETVRFIFAAVESGTPLLEICHQLNDAGIKTTRGHDWTVTPLKYLLRNQTYCGRLEATLDGQHGTFTGKQEPIIDPEQFDRVNAILDARAARRHKYTRHTNQYIHWLSGLVRCPICGSAMSHVTRKDGRRPSYRCNGRGDGKKCSNGATRVYILEDAVINELENITKSPGYIRKIHLATPQPVTDYPAQIKALEKKLQRAKQAYLAEIDTIEEYRENKVQLSRKIEELKEKEKDGAPETSPKEFMQQAQTVLDVLKSDATMNEKAAVSHALIEKVCPDSAAKTIKIYFFA